MLYKIHNPRPATQGIWVSGQRVFVKPGATIERVLSEDDAAAAKKRVELTRISDAPKIDTFAHEFIADLNRLQADRVEFQEVEPSITNGQSLDLEFLSDDQLRDLAKARGIKVHHKAGRAKILEALL